MARIATIPMNPTATKEANDEFYQNHPEMVQDGKRIPIDPCNPMHAKYQKEWMDSYVKHGGKIRIGKEQKQCGNPVQSCPCNGRLVVTVVESIGTKEPVPLVDVEISGPKYDKAQTDAQGKATFSGLEEGTYLIQVPSSDKQYGEIAEVHCRQTSGVELAVMTSGLVVEVTYLKTGHPIVEADVSLSGPTPFQAQRTDNQGRATFVELETGTYDVFVKKAELEHKFHFRIEGAGTKSISKGERALLKLRLTREKRFPVEWMETIVTSEVPVPGRGRIAGGVR